MVGQDQISTQYQKCTYIHDDAVFMHSCVHCTYTTLITMHEKTNITCSYPVQDVHVSIRQASAKVSSFTVSAKACVVFHMFSFTTDITAATFMISIISVWDDVGFRKCFRKAKLP